MRVWLDDERPMPVGYDIHARSAHEAIELLKTGNVEVISLDHDLGSEATGYDVAKWIAKAAYFKSLPKVRVRIHTMNPVGRENIARTIQMAYKYWAAKEKVVCRVCDQEFKPVVTTDLKFFVPKHYHKSLVGGLHECNGSYEKSKTFSGEDV